MANDEIQRALHDFVRKADGEKNSRSQTEPSSIREEILQQAITIVTQDRNRDYGGPEQNFEKIAFLWDAYTGYQFSPHDVAVLLILVKVARIKTSPKKLDHWVDMAGYAACGAECARSAK